MKTIIVLEYLDGSHKSGKTDYDKICDASIIEHNGRYFVYVTGHVLNSPITFSEVEQPYLLTDFEPC